MDRDRYAELPMRSGDGAVMSDRRTRRDEPSDTQKLKTLAREFFANYPVLDNAPQQADDTSKVTEETST